MPEFDISNYQTMGDHHGNPMMAFAAFLSDLNQFIKTLEVRLDDITERLDVLEEEKRNRG